MRRLDSSKFPWIVAGLLVTYLTVRAFYSELTYDEHWTYLAVFEGSGLDLITFKYPCANSHFLSSVFSMTAMRLLPWHDSFTIRLPSVLFAILYISASWRLAWNHPFRWLAFLAFLANPMILTFLGFARGYSLALALEMIALVTLAEGLDGNSKALSGALVASALAVLATLCWAYFFCALAVVVAVAAIRQKQYRPLITLAATSSGLAAFYVPRILAMQQSPNENCRLGFGGHSSFVVDTIGSLCRGTVYGLHGLGIVVAAYLVTVVTIALLVFVPWRWRELGSVSGFLLLAIALASIVAHWFGFAYLLQRTALQMLPLFVCLILFNRSRRLSSVVLAAYLLVSVPGVVVLATDKPSEPTYWFGWGYDKGGQ